MNLIHLCVYQGPSEFKALVNPLSGDILYTCHLSYSESKVNIVDKDTGEVSELSTVYGSTSARITSDNKVTLHGPANLPTRTKIYKNKFYMSISNSLGYLDAQNNFTLISSSGNGNPIFNKYFYGEEDSISNMLVLKDSLFFMGQELVDSSFTHEGMELFKLYEP